MGVYASAEQLIGATPLLALNRTVQANSLPCRIFAKLEFFNIGGSVKDRVAKRMLDEAEEAGLLKPGGTVIEPTSGNTGIGLCAVAAARGYRCIIVMPDTMSIERRLLMAAYGAEVVLSPGKDGMAGAIALAQNLASQHPGSFIPGQFTNPANPAAHFDTTGPEIWEATCGNVDIFVAGIGTGGTVTGVGRYLKTKDPGIRIVGVEPASSPMLSEGKSGSHGLLGIGAGLIPEILDTGILDEVMTVADKDAIRCARELGKREGLLVGISSGAALHAAIRLANRPENEGKTIVTLFPDSGERYLSTGLYG